MRLDAHRRLSSLIRRRLIHTYTHSRMCLVSYRRIWYISSLSRLYLVSISVYRPSLYPYVSFTYETRLYMEIAAVHTLVATESRQTYQSGLRHTSADLGVYGYSDESLSRECIHSNSEGRHTHETGLYTSLYSRYTHLSLPRVDRHVKLVSV